MKSVASNITHKIFFPPLSRHYCPVPDLNKERLLVVHCFYVNVTHQMLSCFAFSKPQWMTIEGWGNRSEDRPRTPGTPPASGTPSVDGTPQRRGDFTRQEYERRQQLKIMEDLDKVLKQKPTTVRGVKKQRPKTVFRDDSSLSHSPIKGLIGK